MCADRGDLAKIRQLRHLRVLDLSRTPIGDRELVQLVDCNCPFIIVPDGQTSEEVRAMFSEDQLALGIGVAEFALPVQSPLVAGQRKPVARRFDPSGRRRWPPNERRPYVKRRRFGSKG